MRSALEQGTFAAIDVFWRSETLFLPRTPDNLEEVLTQYLSEHYVEFSLRPIAKNEPRPMDRLEQPMLGAAASAPVVKPKEEQHHQEKPKYAKQKNIKTEIVQPQPQQQQQVQVKAEVTENVTKSCGMSVATSASGPVSPTEHGLDKV